MHLLTSFSYKLMIGAYDDAFDIHYQIWRSNALAASGGSFNVQSGHMSAFNIRGIDADILGALLYYSAKRVHFMIIIIH